MPPALNQGFTRTLFHMYVQGINESKHHIHCVIKCCWKYRNKYRRTLENYLNSQVPGQVQFLLHNAGIIVLAAMNVYLFLGLME